MDAIYSLIEMRPQNCRAVFSSMLELRFMKICMAVEQSAEIQSSVFVLKGQVITIRAA